MLDIQIDVLSLDVRETYSDFLSLCSVKEDKVNDLFLSKFKTLCNLKKEIDETDRTVIQSANKQLIERQKTWLGWLVSKLDSKNILIKAIKGILQRIFSSFDEEVRKQNDLQGPILELQFLESVERSYLWDLREFERVYLQNLQVI